MSIVWKISNKLQQYHNTNYTGWGYPPAKCITQPKYNIQASSEILGNLRNYSENIVFLTNQVFSKNLLVIFLLTVCTPLTRGNLKHKSCEALISKILGSYSNYDVVSLFHSSLWILATSTNYCETLRSTNTTRHETDWLLNRARFYKSSFPSCMARTPEQCQWLHRELLCFTVVWLSPESATAATLEVTFRLA